MTVATRHRERLEDVRQRTAAARDRIARAKKDRDAAIKDWDGRDPNSEPARRAHAATEAIHAGERDLEMARDEESAVLHQAAGMTVHRSSFLDDPSAVGQLEQLAYSSLPLGNVNLGLAMPAEELVARIDASDWGAPSRMAAAGDVTVSDIARGAGYRGMVPQLRRPLRLLDLIPSAPGSGSGFDYTQETGSFDTAVETVEGAVKPTGEITFTDAEVRYATIPHWVKVPRQQLADVPALQSVIETRLIYGVLRRVENQIVSGDGAGENLRGLLHTSGVASIPFDADVPLAEIPLAGIVDVLLSDATPTATVLHPTDWVKMLTAKSDPSGDYYGGGPFGGQSRTLWDLPSIPSKAIPAGTALVGDWSQITLFVREGANVRAPTPTKMTSRPTGSRFLGKVASGSPCGSRPPSRSSTSPPRDVPGA